MFWKTLLSYAILACCVLSVVVGYLLWSRPHVNRHANRLLAGLLFVYAYIDFVTVLVTTGAIREMPHLFRTAAPFNYAIGPLIFLHVRASLYASTRLRRGYLLLFVPVLLNLIEFTPFYLQSTAVKLTHLEAIAAAPNSLLSISEGWLPPMFHLIGYTLSTLGYTLLTVRLWWRYVRQTGGDPHRNPVYENWITTFVLVQLVANVTWFVEMPLLQNTPYANVSLNLTYVIAQLTICLYILQRPALLYGPYRLERTPARPTPSLGAAAGPRVDHRSKPVPPDDALTAEAVSEQVVQDKLRQLEQYMQRQRPYLRPRLSLADVSVETRIPPYLLSTLLNRALGVDFRDYVNSYRVQYFCELLENDRLAHLTLEGISTQAGFSSKTTFYRAFQKHTGMTPAQFHANRPTGNGHSAVPNP